MSYIIRGKIAAPHKGKDRREITVNNKLECYNLPLDQYPVTHLIRPEGIGVTLKHNVHECEASLHRFEKHFYIGSATRRLGSRDYAEMFRRFLEKVGIVEERTAVKLGFDGYNINISKI